MTDTQTIIKIFRKHLDQDQENYSQRTIRAYLEYAKMYLSQYDHFSKPSIIEFLEHYSQNHSKNSVQLAYYGIKRLCKSLGVKFTVARADLPRFHVYDDDDNVPVLRKADVEKLIDYWKNYPKEYATSLLFLSSVYGLRAIEMSRIIIKGDIITVHIAKRKSAHGKLPLRNHILPTCGQAYLSSYDTYSVGNVSRMFAIVCKRAGVQKPANGGWHCIRRALNTHLLLAGGHEILVKGFLRWVKNKKDMPSLYFHMPPDEIDCMIFDIHPFLKRWQ